MTFRLRPGDRLLFVGDSVTSCSREVVAEPWGAGFVLFLDVMLAARYPQGGFEVINRGVGGDTVVDLERRWERDVIAVPHDWLFVMIGVNDVSFRHMDSLRDRAVSDATYVETYRRLLRRTREATTGPIVLLEPTPFMNPVDPTDRSHPANAEIRRTCGIVAELAAEFGAELVRLHDLFVSHLTEAPARRWMLDHVHPSFRGHGIVALRVLEHLGWSMDDRATTVGQ